MKAKLTHITFLAAVLLWSPGLVQAQTEIGPEDSLGSALDALQPGDELILRGGMYAGGFRTTLVGTAGSPIVVRAKDGEVPRIHYESADKNIMEVSGSSYAVFRGLEFSGGSHGIRLMSSNFITIEDCEVHDTGDVAISANSGGSYEGLRFLRNHIHHTHGTGEGMYLGCNNDACRIFNSLIEGNYIHHTDGPSVEQGDGIEIKEGSYNNIVRDNVIHNTNYPCILTYSTAGNGAPNILERNILWNCGDHGIQSAADAIIRDNIILSANGDGIAMQNHQSGSPSNLTLVHNTITKGTGDAITIRNISGPITIANNAIYAQGGAAIALKSGDTSMVTVAGNIGSGSTEGFGAGFDGSGVIGSDFVAGHFNGSPPIDLFPASGSRLAGGGSPPHVSDFDFNGTARNGVADVGAYAFSAAGNPGWAATAGFKGATGGPGPGLDGGTGGPDGGAGGGPDAGTSTATGGCSAMGSERTLASRWSLFLLAAVALVSRRRRARD